MKNKIQLTGLLLQPGGCSFGLIRSSSPPVRYYRDTFREEILPFLSLLSEWYKGTYPAILPLTIPAPAGNYSYATDPEQTFTNGVAGEQDTVPAGSVILFTLIALLIQRRLSQSPGYLPP